MTDIEEFRSVVEFHGCFCLDIAVGYRVAKALMREMGEEVNNLKDVFAQVGTSTCAIDAIQKITGCTLGKRNLIMSDLGKPVYILQNAKTGHAVRAYVHFWEGYDQHEIGKYKSAAKVDADGKQALQDYLESKIDEILSLPDDALFSLKHVNLTAPGFSGKFEAKACDICGEYVNTRYLQGLDNLSLCPECLS